MVISAIASSSSTPRTVRVRRGSFTRLPPGNQRRGSGMRTCRRASKSSTHLPVPSTTESSGLSTRWIGMPVSSRSRSSRFFSRAPPPVSATPRSMTSPDSSGGHLSSVVLTASTIALTGSSIARRTSSAEMMIVFGRPLTQHEGVFLFGVGHDGLVELVAADPHGLAGDDAAGGDDRPLGGPAADVDHHVAGGLVHRQAGADGGGHRLFDDVDAARPGLVAGLLDGALLDAGDAARHRHDDPGFREMPSFVDLLDEVAEHPLGDIEVGDDTVLERAYGDDVARRAADHPFGLDTYRDDLAGVGVDSYNGGFVEDNAAAADVHQRVRRTQIDRHVSAEERQLVTHEEMKPFPVRRAYREACPS